MDAPYEALEKIFHEPSRLAIMSELAAEPEGLTFKDLKERCALTDGNLSRHLSMLERAGVLTIKKEFVGAKPRTTAVLSRQGRTSFLEYLTALEKVLKQAAKRAGSEKSQTLPAASRKPAKA